MKILWQKGMAGRKCAECEFQAMPIEVKGPGPMTRIFGWMTRCEDCVFSKLTYSKNPFKALFDKKNPRISPRVLTYKRQRP
jgi:hypothetical protein